MDPVAEIKARLPIEDLVGRYTRLQKKGRNFVGLCPFHNDKKPSMLVSPDKGIAYCFPCQKGGDIFSFYQAAEGVDFRQALKDLAERTGVTLPDAPRDVVNKDEKERARECLEEAHAFFRKSLKAAPAVLDYLAKRGVGPEEIEAFGIGFAPDSFSAAYDHLLKAGFSRSEIVRSGVGAQRDLKEERVYDRFRNRVMFPIHDHQGRIAGFGGRTLGNDDAKYLNSPDGPLFRKSSLLFGYHHAREAIRERKEALVVEGYFDVLACHRVGMRNAVAACGTALTEEHARLLKRSAEKVVLCLDQDRAGRDAAERAFGVLAREGLAVHGVVLPEKDPADAVLSSPELLKQLLSDGGLPYVELVIEDLAGGDVRSAAGKRAALARLLPLLQAVPTSVERGHYVGRAAALFGVTEATLQDDLRSVPRPQAAQPAPSQAARTDLFASAEIALGLFFLYPHCRDILAELIAPEEGFGAALHAAISAVPPGAELTPESVALTPEHRERLQVLLLFCEQHDFAAWSDSLAPKEIRRNCLIANRECLRRKQRDIAAKLLEASRAGKIAEEELLRTQYQQLLKLAKLAS